MKRLFVIFAGLALAAPLAAQDGTSYRWEKDGQVFYSDTPPPRDAENVSERRDLSGPEEQAPLPPVRFYVVPDCSPCDGARAYLQSRKVPFTEINVSTDPEKQIAMKEAVGFLSVPTIVIGKKVMKGYLRSILEGELNDAGYVLAAEGARAPAEGLETPDEEPEPPAEDEQN